MGFLSPKGPTPPPIPIPPAAATPPTMANSEVNATAMNAKGKAASAASADGTNVTGPQGLKPPETAKSTLLG